MATVAELDGRGCKAGARRRQTESLSQSHRAPLQEDQVRAVVGAAFFVLPVTYAA